MVRSKLCGLLRKHRGVIYLDVSNHDDTFWLQGVKLDLIYQMSHKFKAQQETGFTFQVTDGVGYFSKDYALPSAG